MKPIAMKQFPILFLLPMILLAACGDGASERDPKAAEMAERIRMMEDSLFEHMTMERRGAQALIDVYKAYATTFPADTLAPEYLFRAANVSKNMRDPEQSIFLYDRIIRDYSGWSRIADAYYLRAFTLDSEMGNKGEAEVAYREVISRFPDHPFARDARIMIENLQYSDEELIERFKAMEQDSAAAEAGR